MENSREIAERILSNTPEEIFLKMEIIKILYPEMKELLEILKIAYEYKSTQKSE